MSNRRHSMYGTSEYNAYYSMIARCTNPKTRNYIDYGGRGIKICQRWLDSFENFYKDMGPKPQGLTLERKDTNGDYSPENCKWATYLENGRNRRNTVLMTYNGTTKAIEEWVKDLSIPYRTLYRYCKQGEQVLTDYVNTRLSTNLMFDAEGGEGWNDEQRTDG